MADQFDDDVFLSRNQADKPVASGIYFYRLQTRQSVQTKKLIYIK